MKMKFKRIIASFMVMCVAFSTLLIEDVVFASGGDAFEPLNIVLPYGQSSGDYADPNGTGLIFRYEGSNRWERALTYEKTRGERKCRVTLMCCREGSNLHTSEYYNWDCKERLASKMIYKVDNSKLSADERELTIEFDYYDDPEFSSNSAFSSFPSIEFKYLAYDGGSTPKINVVRVPTEGTGTWKTAKFTINDAQFNHATAPNSSSEGFQDGYDICIGMGGNRGGFASTYLTISPSEEGTVAERDAKNLQISETVIGDFELPVAGDLGSEISWTSSNTNIISITGNKATVNSPAINTDVELTATVKYADETITKKFTVTVVGDDARMSTMVDELTTYVLTGQKYIMESFTPNIPGLSGTDIVEITSSDSAVSYDKLQNKVNITNAGEDKIVDVTVKVTSKEGTSITKTLKFYIPSDSVVGAYEDFNYPSLKGGTINPSDAWAVWSDDTNLNTTGVAVLVNPSPDDATDLVMDINAIRTIGTSQYASWSGNATVAGDAILQTNIKFNNTVGNQIAWYITGNVKTSAGESSKEIIGLYMNRGNGTITCEVSDGTAITVSKNPLPTNEWFNFKFVIHTTDNNYDLYVDNVKINESPISFKNVTANGAVTSIKNIVMGPTRWSVNPGHMYVDDLMIRSSMAEILATEAKMLDIPSTFIYDYKMPTEGLYEGTTVTWESDNESILSKDGKVNRNIGLGNTAVTLTAKIQNGSTVLEKEFDVDVVNTPNYTIDSLVFATAGGTESYSAEPGGKLKYASVTKYTTSTSDNATLYVAMYDANDRLVTVGPVKKVTATGNITFDMDIPQIDGIYAKAFIWNGNNLAPLAYTYSTKVEEGTTIYTIGDSTMQSYGTVEARQNDNQMTGWVQVLPLAITDDSLTIENKAVSGTSTLSFTNLGYIYPIYEDIKPGDYLVIQFGHNDEKPWMDQDAGKNYSPLEGDHNNHPNANPVPDWAKSRKTYEQWLREYAAAARMKGAQVIFATSIYRRNFTNGVVTYNHYGYPEAMIDTAAELNAPLLDLHARSGEWLERNGKDGSLKYYVAFHGGTDNTHLTYDGAVEIANMAIGEMNRIGHPIAECFGTVPLR